MSQDTVIKYYLLSQHFFFLQKFKVKDFDIFSEKFQNAYEFYDALLKSGEKELELGANRLTSRQLFWVAAARVEYTKYQFEDFRMKDNPYDFENGKKALKF